MYFDLHRQCIRRNPPESRNPGVDRPRSCFYTKKVQVIESKRTYSKQRKQLHESPFAPSRYEWHDISVAPSLWRRRSNHTTRRKCPKTTKEGALYIYYIPLRNTGWGWCSVSYLALTPLWGYRSTCSWVNWCRWLCGSPVVSIHWTGE